MNFLKKNTSLRTIGIFFVILLLSLTNTLLVRATSYPERISVASDGSEGNNAAYTTMSDNSALTSISENGRYATFVSLADNLVSGDTNGVADVFVRDRVAGTTERVSVASDGSQGNGSSYEQSISNDGRYVAFVSHATNLVSGDTNTREDIFVRDRVAGTTQRVSVASDGSQGNNYSSQPSFSDDGRYVVFISTATNLVSGDTNGREDVFVRDLVAGTTERVSIASDGTQGNGVSSHPSISDDGHYVAFHSMATNLVSGDTNARQDIFVRDRVAGTTERVSVASDESQGNNHSSYPSISDDGQHVAFASEATNLVSGDTNGVRDIFVRDLAAGTTERVSVASDESQSNGESLWTSISGNGQYVAFAAWASNLAPQANAGSNVYVRDLAAGSTAQVSVTSDGSQGDSHSERPSISNTGQYVVFISHASNMVSGDTNNFRDVFVSLNPLWNEPMPELVTAVNAGGTSTENFVADAGYQGGNVYSSSETVNTTGVDNPAPQDVYKTVRYGNFTYTISNLTPNASYGVRLHFNELYWNSIGARVFDVKYNGQTVLDNYDIFEAAGEKNKAVVVEVNGTTDSNGTVNLQFITEFDNAMVNGIEVYSGILDTPTPTPTPTLSVPYGINTGGTTVGSYVADRNFSGGSLYTTTNNVDTTGVTNPAPEAVYQSVRYGNFTYTLPNLTPNTQYKLRLHFNELYWSSAGSRLADVFVNGTQVLNDYDIYVAAGGQNKAVVEEISVTSNASGNLVVQFTTVVDNAMVNGIEVVNAD